MRAWSRDNVDCGTLCRQQSRGRNPRWSLRVDVDALNGVDDARVGAVLDDIRARRVHHDNPAHLEGARQSRARLLSMSPEQVCAGAMR